MDHQHGWHLEATGPVIKAMDQWQNCRGRMESEEEEEKAVDRWGAIVEIRHNDLDRLPDLPPVSVVDQGNVDEYYQELEQAHFVWDGLLASDRFRLVVKMEPGDTMVVANHVSDNVMDVSGASTWEHVKYLA